MTRFVDDNDAFGRLASKRCYELYKRVVGKQKKKVLADHEWTNMACMVKTDEKNDIEIVTMATGTKCIGESHRVRTGRILNDSHAEVLARRLLLKYFYQQILLALEKSSQSIFAQEEEYFTLKKGVKFHLFTTEVPCGDAAIFPKLDDQRQGIKRKIDVDGGVGPKTPKRFCLDNTFKNNEETLTKGSSDQDNTNEKCENVKVNDIHRTGAKCVSGGAQDALQPGLSYHVTGALRIKPGRGFRTVSMSCSDKLLKWCCLGIQGGLLRNFLKEEIFLSSIIVAAPLYDHAAMKRALSDRNRELFMHIHQPTLIHCRSLFTDCNESITKKYDGNGKVLPSGTAILWCGSCDIHEFSSNGRRHGVTKKLKDTDKA